MGVRERVDLDKALALAIGLEDEEIVRKLAHGKQARVATRSSQRRARERLGFGGERLGEHGAIRG
jgi:hypothetical protein